MFDNQKGPSDSTLLRYFVCGIVVCGAVAAAIFKPSTGDIFQDLFSAGCIVFGAFFAVIIIALVGGVIDRVFLGNDGTEEPSKLRFIFCIALLVVLTFSIIYFINRDDNQKGAESPSTSQTTTTTATTTNNIFNNSELSW